MKNTLLVVSLILSAIAQADDRTVIRAAFDIGSTTTKMKVARVDVDTQRVVEQLPGGKIETKVGYKDDLKKNDGSLSEAVQLEGVQALQSMKEIAESLGATEFAGVATSAFRDAKNRDGVVARLSLATGIRIRVITQEQEGRLGAIGGMAAVETPSENVVVWDIGGGSQQLTTIGSDCDACSPSYFTVGTQIGSVTFKDRLISDVRHQDPKQVKSPNPIAPDTEAAVDLSNAIASSTINSTLVLDKLKAQGTVVVGIGGVFAFSLKGQVAGIGADGVFTKEQLEAAIAARAPLGDDAIGGKYKETEVSNLVLVKGHMDALGITSITIRDVNLTDATLIYPDYWLADETRK